ncbi:deoxyribonuclease tatD [Perkinsela sp. CCAP 1560/4]|nr:deoxyribonuclease tatD [Perkinsela sp. CCAP 1560/4]|eukprot:KNH04364.1 deoxyribonuclease tatD [Perkinsela sp. CCAP 1560/4]
MEYSEGQWNDQKGSGRRRKDRTWRIKGESNDSANNTRKIASAHISDPEKRLALIKTKIGKIKRSADFATVQESLNKVYQAIFHTTLQVCHTWRKQVKFANICEVHFLGFGIGDFLDNANALPQFAFFLTMQRQLSAQLNEMAKSEPRNFSSHSQKRTKFRNLLRPEVYDPVYSLEDRNIIGELGVQSRNDHHCFSIESFERELREWPYAEDKYRVYVIFIPHTPVELPALILLDLIDTVNRYPAQLRENILLYFIGNPIFPLNCVQKGCLSLVKEIDVGCEYDPAFAAFFNMKLTPVVFPQENQPSNILTSAIVIDEDLENALRIIAQRHLKKSKSEMI